MGAGGKKLDEILAERRQGERVGYRYENVGGNCTIYLTRRAGDMKDRLNSKKDGRNFHVRSKDSG